MKKLRLGILASGGGTNLQSIIDGCAAGTLSAEVAIVICNNPGAGALTRAETAGLKTCCINHRDFTRRSDFDSKVVKQLQAANVELVVLAGFMRIISPVFLEAYPQRIINIHPALLPAFPGLHVQQQAIDYGARFSGCTVHLVDAGVDTGPIVLQAVVPVLEDDSAEDLAARILIEEHKIYPQAIQLFAEGRLLIENRRVRILPKTPNRPESSDEPEGND
ncbi:phosphoribosylglycinamide formyltransferase [Geopsychrobacter electrodiphilus]|uniref:phosphoribosylglycinamide formyltransferase n=1 Tax=Geopsychrobacter electrodiphilus TaxID=225196 RepID=UPI000377F171|nr:phosphoribosylglycinamide formyltransferase [Geopsychrobacter electrodiphilus]